MERDQSGRPALRVYLRSATETPGADALGTQRDACEEFVRSALEARAGIVLSWDGRREYGDAGTVGAHDGTKPPALAQLVADTQPGDVVVIQDLTRISRSWPDASAALRALVGTRGARVFVAVTRQEASTDVFKGWVS
jgi:DNA invertase Pin-like site-specific DNA recombinase